MKKVLILTFVMIFISFISLSVKLSANEEIEFDGNIFAAGDSEYQVTDRKSDQIIDYGIRYINDIAVSKSTTQIGATNTLDPQVVNVLEVPTSSVMKVVNWTYSSSSGWTTQTLTKLADRKSTV